jgi:phasin family protein
MTVTPKFEDFQKFSKQQLEAVNAIAASVTKGFQEIASESTDYSKKAFAANSAVVEQLLGAKSVETAIQIQTDYAKAAYDGFVAQATKLNELYVKLASEAFKPVESAFASVGKSVEAQV